MASKGKGKGSKSLTGRHGPSGLTKGQALEDIKTMLREAKQRLASEEIRDLLDLKEPLHFTIYTHVNADDTVDGELRLMTIPKDMSLIDAITAMGQNTVSIHRGFWSSVGVRFPSGFRQLEPEELEAEEAKGKRKKPLKEAELPLKETELFEETEEEKELREAEEEEFRKGKEAYDRYRGLNMLSTYFARANKTRLDYQLYTAKLFVNNLERAGRQRPTQIYLRIHWNKPNRMPTKRYGRRVKEE